MTRLFVPIIKILTVFAILGLIAWAILKSNPTEFLKATVHWDIDETLPIKKMVLKGKIQMLIEDKYQLNLQQIKEALESEPWVEEARIKRLFWNAIQIKIKARRIGMRWQNVGCNRKQLTACKGYISTKGVLFMPKKLVSSDAVLAISKQNKDSAKLYEYYQRYQKLAKPMRIKSFFRTNIDQLEFASGVSVILGYQKHNERLEKFIKAYNKLKKRNSKVKHATFDMRYPKGFAISY